jgi:hypothetical protein
MKKNDRKDFLKIDIEKRRLVKALGIISSGLLTSFIPEVWSKPVVDIVTLPSDRNPSVLGAPSPTQTPTPYPSITATPTMTEALHATADADWNRYSNAHSNFNRYCRCNTNTNTNTNFNPY